MTEAELIRRLDRTIERNSEVIALNEQSFRQLVASHGRLVKAVARLDATVDDLRDEIRANIQATLRLIDRLGPEPRSNG